MSVDAFSKFNLIPPKTKEELVTIEERDNSILYSLVLIFFAAIIFAIFTLGKTLLVDTQKQVIESSILQQEKEMTSYNPIKKINGEVFVKSNALSSIVEKDIKLTELIDVANKLVLNVPNSVILNYARVLEGEFVVAIELSSYSDINGISANASEIPSLKDLYIKSLTTDSSGTRVIAVVSFTLTNIN